MSETEHRCLGNLILHDGSRIQEENDIRVRNPGVLKGVVNTWICVTNESLPRQHFRREEQHSTVQYDSGDFSC